jgi:hypothetical protein
LVDGTSKYLSITGWGMDEAGSKTDILAPYIVSFYKLECSTEQNVFGPKM